MGCSGGRPGSKDRAGVGVFDPERQIPSARVRYHLAIGIEGRGSYIDYVGWC